ncbi:hypothetical protein K474DRAFT_1670324 [Panus rudis PR-1116 ss-1]|nr:hypothetical protein K474DRAFT_1670324 [Panus rudis PR-1116 ss-1]
MGWVPKSPGAMVGACIGLFLLGVAERLVAAVRGVGERFWRERALVLRAERLRNAEKLPMNSPNSPTRSTPDLKTISSSSKSSSSASIASISSPSPSTNADAITPLKDAITMRDAPPFILAHDVTRGVLYACQAALQFALMLAVMYYQVGFILSIVIGLGFGEMLFGRFTH